MQIVHVIPIARGIGKETLSYFSARSVAPGEVVRVPLRQKRIPAVVIASENAGTAKAAIRSSRYALKRVYSQPGGHFLSPQFMKAVEATAMYFAGTMGAAMHAIVPTILWEPGAADVSKRHVHANGVDAPQTVVPERLILQSEAEERWSRYRSIMREAFARGESLFICIPTIAEGEYLFRELGRGIGAYVHLLHGKLTKKVVLERLIRIRASEHPVAIIGTPSFLAVERPDIRTIIVERERASAYKTHVRPYIDMRVFIECLAKEKQARLILADMPLRVEIFHKFQRGIYEALVPPQIHPKGSATQSVVDMRADESRKRGTKKECAIISRELRDVITRVEETRSRLFIFAARRGLASTTVCQDCGSVVVDETSNTPVILYRGTNENIFVSHATGVARSAKERCRACGSWRLISLGIGIQRVEDELRRLTKAPIFSIDRDSTPTHARARAIAEKFYKTKGSILIGTEMALPYLAKSIPHVAVASCDALLSHPDWRMSENVCAILLALRNQSEHTFTVQTRRPDEPLLSYAMDGNIMDFYRAEIELREKLRYPPFTVMLKIQTQCAPTRIEAETAWLEARFKAHKLRIYLPAIAVKRGSYSLQGILRVPADKWPNAELIAELKALPPQYAVSVDPSSLL